MQGVYSGINFMVSWQACTRPQNQLGLLVCSVIDKTTLDEIKASERNQLWILAVKVEHMPPHSNARK